MAAEPHAAPQHHHGGLGTRPSSRDEPTRPHPAIELPRPAGEPGCAGRGCCWPQSSEGRARQELPGHASASSGNWAGCRRMGSVQEPPRSATAKAWVRTKVSLGKGGRGIENTDTNVLGKRRAQGLDVGGHKPQPAAASTASRQHRRCSHNARPATGRVGSPPPATVLSHGAETQPRHRPTASGRCCGTVRQVGTPACLLLQLQGLPSRQRVPAFHNSGSEEKPISLCPQAPPQPRACCCGPSSLGKG